LEKIKNVPIILVRSQYLKAEEVLDCSPLKTHFDEVLPLLPQPLDSERSILRQMGVRRVPSVLELVRCAQLIDASSNQAWVEEASNCLLQFLAKNCQSVFGSKIAEEQFRSSIRGLK
jgi:hypothetical protein